MAQIVTKKIALLIAALLIGGGGLLVSMMVAQENQISVLAAPEKSLEDKKIDETTDKSTITEPTEAAKTEFLNYDMVIGQADAPVEIIEYAAISCSHCAEFHENIYPELKKRFLDTGKAKLVYRNFIFDNPFDVFASSLTRCVPENRFMATVKTYFDYQKVWNNIPGLQKTFKEQGREAAIKFAQDEVAKIGKTTGISEEDSAACYANDEVINYLIQVRQAAVATYQVNSTPTVIVDGKKLDNHDIEAIAKAIEAAGK